MYNNDELTNIFQDSTIVIGNRKEGNCAAKICYFLNCNKTYSNWQLESVSNEHTRVRVSQYLCCDRRWVCELRHQWICKFVRNYFVVAASSATAAVGVVWSQTMICVRLARITLRPPRRIYRFNDPYFFFFLFNICDEQYECANLRMLFTTNFSFIFDSSRRTKSFKIEIIVSLIRHRHQIFVYNYAYSISITKMLWCFFFHFYFLIEGAPLNGTIYSFKSRSKTPKISLQKLQVCWMLSISSLAQIESVVRSWDWKRMKKEKIVCELWTKEPNARTHIQSATQLKQ